MQEWAAKCTQAVVGDISIADYQKYVDEINNRADVKAAYKEFRDSYKEIFG
jgi:hypothetical protein